MSSCVTYAHSTISEWEFLGAVAQAADCGILLDVNNVYVGAMNHGFSADAYLAGLPLDRIGQIHLAGHSDAGTQLVDTHDHAVPPPVAPPDAAREAIGVFASWLEDGIVGRAEPTS